MWGAGFPLIFCPPWDGCAALILPGALHTHWLDVFMPTPLYQWKLSSSSLQSNFKVTIAFDWFEQFCNQLRNHFILMFIDILPIGHYFWPLQIFISPVAPPPMHKTWIELNWVPKKPTAKTQLLFFSEETNLILGIEKWSHPSTRFSWRID